MKDEDLAHIEHKYRQKGDAALLADILLLVNEIHRLKMEALRLHSIIKLDGP